MGHSIERYLNVRRSFSPGFLGDKNHIVFLNTTTGVPQIWEVASDALDETLRWPDQLTFETERIMDMYCSPREGDRRLIYTRDIGGNENAQLFLLDAGTDEERCLSTGHADALHSFGCWSHDGQAIVFAANRRVPNRFDLYVQPLNGEARLVWQNDVAGFLHDQVLSPDGQRVIVCLATSTFHADVWEINLESGAARQVSHLNQEARYGAPVFAASGDSVYLLTDVDADFLYVAELDLTSGDMKPLITAEWDIELLAGSRDGRVLAYSVNNNGANTLHVFDIASGATKDAPIDHGMLGVVGNLDGHLRFDRGGQLLAYSYMTSAFTSEICVWNVSDGRQHVATRSGYAGLNPRRFVDAELIHYPTFDGRSIPAWWYPASDASGRGPAVVIVHGGPESQFRPFFQPIVQYFVANGYSVLAPNVRGSTGYGKHYSHLDDRELRMDAVNDLAHAAHWLHGRSTVDPERIAVYGGSYGGFMVLAALTAHPQLWAAGVDIVGISNFVTFLQNTSGYRRAHREMEYGSLEQNRAFLERVSPIAHVDNIVAPLMVIHGANDPRVPLSEAQQLVDSLVSRDVPVDFMVFDDEGHGLAKLKNQLVAFPAIVAFLDRYVRSKGQS
ncbi:MAG: S9 family peptidase [Herpetosiphon sp.]